MQSSIVQRYGLYSKYCNPCHYRPGSDEVTKLVTLAEYCPEIENSLIGHVIVLDVFNGIHRFYICRIFS